MPNHGMKPKPKPKSKKGLKGGQKKLDKDGDGKISKKDFEMLRKDKKPKSKSKLTDKQEEKMKEHSKHHSSKHMKEMRKLMMKGHSFTKAHNEAKKMEKK